MKLKKAIEERRSVRKFKLKKPDWRDIIEAVDSMRYAPMSGGNFSLRVVLVQDKKKIKKLGQYTQQDFVASAHYVVVVCSDIKKVKNLYPEDFERFFRQQAGAGIQNFLLSLEEKGLSSCWVGHFMEDKLKNLLDIDKSLRVEAIIPIGYEHKKPVTRKAKLDLDKFLYFDFYKNKRMNPSLRENPK